MPYHDGVCGVRVGRRRLWRLLWRLLLRWLQLLLRLQQHVVGKLHLAWKCDLHDNGNDYILLNIRLLYP